MQGFIERHEKIRFDVLTRVVERFATRRAARIGGAPGAESVASTREEGFEKIAESGAAELDVRLGRTRARSTVSCWTPVFVLPIRAEFVGAFPLGRIAKHFVGLVDLFEFRFTGDLILRDVGMMKACEFAEGQFELFRRGVAGHAQGFVVILEFHRWVARVFRPLRRGLRRARWWRSGWRDRIPHTG